MKRIGLIILLIVTFSSTEALGLLRLEEQWSITKKVHDWDISYSGNFLGFIDDTDYYIYNKKGEIFLKGNNIWHGNEIEITDEKFLISSPLYKNAYSSRIFYIFSYDGQFIRRSLPTGKNYFTPQGTFVISEWGEWVFVFTNSSGQYQKADRVPPPYHPYESYPYYKNNITYISNDDRFIVTDNGIFENRKGELINVLDFPSWNFECADFVKNNEYILVKFENNILEENGHKTSVIYKLYDTKINLVWERDDIQGEIYGYNEGFITTENNKITFYNIDGEIVHQGKLPEEILKVFSFAKKDFILIQLKDNRLVQMDFTGNVMSEIRLEPSFIFAPDGETVYKYQSPDNPYYDNDNYHSYYYSNPPKHPYTIELTCYRIVY